MLHSRAVEGREGGVGAGREGGVGAGREEVLGQGGREVLNIHHIPSYLSRESISLFIQRMCANLSKLNPFLIFLVS